MRTGNFSSADTFGGYGSLLLSRKNDFFSSPESEQQKKIYAAKKEINKLADELRDKLFPMNDETKKEIEEMLAGVKPSKFRTPEYDYLDLDFIEAWREILSEKDLVLRNSALEKEVIKALEQFLLEQSERIEKEHAHTIRRLLEAIYARLNGTKQYFRPSEK